MAIKCFLTYKFGVVKGKKTPTLDAAINLV